MDTIEKKALERTYREPGLDKNGAPYNAAASDSLLTILNDELFRTLFASHTDHWADLEKPIVGE